MYCAFRKVDPDDKSEHWLNRWASWTTSSNLCHVELVIKMACMEDRSCCESYASVFNFGHYYTFSVTSMSDGVFCLLDKDYTDTTKWEYVPLLCNVPMMRRHVYDFMTTQRGKPFNSMGMYLNFWTCVKVGMKDGDDYTRARSWFCSELIAACLSYCGLVDLDGASPCDISPARLYHMLQDQRDYPRIPALSAGVFFDS